ncbi:MAG: purine-nucleoside phosphorylase [Oscillospiraceae bacterium]|nr:purine-nucleoside phosphorylase [Oscillospiraceae bacterium]
MTVSEKLQLAYNSFRTVTKGKLDNFTPRVGIVLGSGLGALADECDTVATVNYNEIDGFPVSTAPGHKGRFVFANIGDTPVVFMQGRVHYYEGYPITDVVLPIRLIKLMGAEYLLLTNASGSVNPDYKAGDFMIISDHIMNFVPSPLVGANIDNIGVRFPDMSEIYRAELRANIRAAAAKIGVTPREGVYIQLTGPNYETPAEVRMCRILGADAVGMSTAAEAVAANHVGLKVAGISCVCNLGSGLSPTPLSGEEVIAAGEKAAPLFKALVRESIQLFGK